LDRYTTGEVAQTLRISKTTVINYIKDFNLDICQNPTNNYREFTFEDLQTIKQIHELVKRVGKDQALKEWHTPKAIPKEAGEAIKEAFEGYKQTEQDLKEVFARQDQINQFILSQQQQIITLLNGLPSSNRKEIESLIVNSLPNAMTEVLNEKAKEIALQREQEKGELEELKDELKALRVGIEEKDKLVMQLLQELKETKQQVAATQEKKGFWVRLIGR
jgi:DNA-binding transcriptional MerR regulator